MSTAYYTRGFTLTQRNYRDLIAWQKAMDLVEVVYKATGQFPREELYGLSNQIRRAAVSVPSNIAEGQGRGATNDFRRFLTMSYGSLREVETQILIAKRLHYLTEAQAKSILELTSEVGRLINGLRNSLERRSTQPA